MRLALVLLLLAAPIDTGQAAGTASPLSFGLHASVEDADPPDPGQSCTAVRPAYRLTLQPPAAPGRAYVSGQPCLTGFHHEVRQRTILSGPFQIHADIGCDMTVPTILMDFRFQVYHVRDGQESILQDVGVNEGIGSCGPADRVRIHFEVDFENRILHPGDWLVLRVSHLLPSPQLRPNVFVLVGPAQPPIFAGPPHPDPVPDAGGPKGPVGPLRGTSTDWALLAFAAPTILFVPKLRHIIWVLYARVLPERLARHPVRGRILEAVRTNPGVSLRELEHDLSVGRPTLRFHVDMLLRGHLLTARRVGRSRHLFVVGHVSSRKHEAKALLRRAWAQRVVQIVRQRPGLSQKELADALGSSPSTTHWFAEKLEAAGILESHKSRGLRLYHLREE